MRRLLILILLFLPVLTFSQVKIDSIPKLTEVDTTTRFPTIHGPEGAKRWKYFTGKEVRIFSSPLIFDRNYIPSETGHSIEDDFGNIIRSSVDGNIYYCDYNGNCVVLSGGSQSEVIILGEPSDPNLFYDIQYKSALSIPTYNASSNVTHPDVIYFPNKWNGYRYWMIFTPYPSEPDENPSVIVSNDGDSWIEPPGITNPIQLYPGSGWNSDPTFTTIISGSDTTLVAVYNQQEPEEVLYKTSEDGVTWSDSMLLWQIDDGANELVSPTIAQLNGNYHMWYSKYYGSTKEDMVMFHRQAATFQGLGGATPDTCVFTNPYANKWIWHYQINFSEKKNEFVGVASFTDEGSPNADGDFHYMTSTDGVNWNISSKTMFDLSEKMESRMYVTSIVETGAADTVGATFDAFTSTLGTWRIFRGKVFIKDTMPPTLENNWDAYKSEIGVCYSFKQRFTDWYGLPVCELYTETKDSTGFIYHADSVLLDVVDSVSYLTWANGEDIFLSKMYDQNSASGNFMQFTDSVPLFDSLATGIPGVSFHLDGVDQHGRSISGGNLKTAILSVNSTDVNGKIYSAASNYGELDRVLTGANNFSFIRPFYLTNILTYEMDSDARVRFNGVNFATGTLTQPSSNDLFVGVFDATGGLQDWVNMRASDFVTLRQSATDDTMTGIENTLLNIDYPNILYRDTLFFDSFSTDHDSLLSAHTPDINELGFDLYSSGAGLFQIDTTLGDGRLKVKTGQGGTIYLVFDPQAVGYVIEFDLYKDGTGFSGIQVKRQDANNTFEFRQEVNGTTRRYRIVGGSQTTLSGGSASNSNPVRFKAVILENNNIIMYMNGREVYRGGAGYFDGETSFALERSSVENPEIDNVLIYKYEAQ